MKPILFPSLSISIILFLCLIGAGSKDREGREMGWAKGKWKGKKGKREKEKIGNEIRKMKRKIEREFKEREKMK